LYKKDQKGAIRVWAVSADDYSIETVYGVLDGEMQDNSEFISEGKAGRSRHEQMMSRINSMIEKRLDKGYLYSIEEARIKGKTNRIGLPKPMLAKKFYDCESKVVYQSSTIQYKYNGFRCLITKQNGKLIAYSRNGKIFDTIDHIFKELILSEGETVDGELYCHGESLQTISSWAKRKQKDTARLQYIIYDYVSNENFIDRRSMSSLCKKEIAHSVHLAQCFHARNRDELMGLLAEAITNGYEGLMVRNNKSPYTPARSDGLLKLKSFDGKKYLHDDEFLVVGVNESSDGWAILMCTTKDGKPFRVTAPGTVSDKIHVFQNMDDYIGKYVQVGYSELTPDGKPFHPVAIQWRNKYDE